MYSTFFSPVCGMVAYSWQSKSEEHPKLNVWIKYKKNIVMTNRCKCQEIFLSFKLDICALFLHAHHHKHFSMFSPICQRGYILTALKL